MVKLTLTNPMVSLFNPDSVDCTVAERQESGKLGGMERVVGMAPFKLMSASHTCSPSVERGTTADKLSKVKPPPCTTLLVESVGGVFTGYTNSPAVLWEEEEGKEEEEEEEAMTVTLTPPQNPHWVTICALPMAVHTQLSAPLRVTLVTHPEESRYTKAPPSLLA